jgi:threonine aldolase
MLIDLRSDTVTQPTLAMREAIAQAPVGDDVLGDDPTIQALETQVAQILGKEAAVFMPSGTMTNQVALRTHTEPGDEVINLKRSRLIPIASRPILFYSTPPPFPHQTWLNP